LEKLGERLTPECAAQVLIAQKFLMGFDAISKNPADKVFLPASFQGLFSIATDRRSDSASRGGE
jgi:hypothetical protein